MNSNELTVNYHNPPSLYLEAERSSLDPPDCLVFSLGTNSMNEGVEYCGTDLGWIPHSCEKFRSHCFPVLSENDQEILFFKKKS